MGKSCIVVGCVNKSGFCTKSFYRVPSHVAVDDTSVRRRALWLSRLGLQSVSSSARVCSDHFLTGRKYDNYGL